jgi:3-hydroxypropionyl-CoA synthetase (ADP-forming)
VQSGTYGAAFLEFVAAKEIGIRSFFSYGNRVDVDEGDLIEYFAEDPYTKVMGFYIEALSDGRKLVNRAKNVVNRKPIVIYKAGKTEQGAKAALSHTGWLSKSPQVNEGILSQAGIILAKNFQQQCAMINALIRQPPARGPYIAFVSNGIGPCVGAIDLIQENPLQLAELRSESIEEMEEAYPYFYIPQNPVDVTGSATSRDYEIAIQVLMKDPNVDICMPYFVFQDTPLDEGIVEVLEKAKQAGKPILVGAIGGPYTKQMSAQIEMKGIPVFSAVGDWVAAAEALYLHGKNLGLSKEKECN